MAAATIRNFAKHATASRETMSARFLLRGLCIGTIRVSIRFIVKRIDYLGAIKGTIWLSIAPPPKVLREIESQSGAWVAIDQATKAGFCYSYSYDCSYDYCCWLLLLLLMLTLVIASTLATTTTATASAATTAVMSQ